MTNYFVLLDLDKFRYKDVNKFRYKDLDKFRYKDVLNNLLREYRYRICSHKKSNKGIQRTTLDTYTEKLDEVDPLLTKHKLIYYKIDNLKKP